MRTIIIFTLAKSGAISDVRVVDSSSSDIFDKTAVAALKNFQATRLPELCSDEPKEIIFKFESEEGLPPSIKLPFEPITTVSPDKDFGLYMAALQRRIRKQWKPPETRVNRKTVVSFVADREGYISDVRVVTPSGDARYDECGIQAIKNIGQFNSLPVGFKESSITIQFTFELEFPKNAALSPSSPPSQKLEWIFSNPQKRKKKRAVQSSKSQEPMKPQRGSLESF